MDLLIRCFVPKWKHFEDAEISMRKDSLCKPKSCKSANSLSKSATDLSCNYVEACEDELVFVRRTGDDSINVNDHLQPFNLEDLMGAYAEAMFCGRGSCFGVSYKAILDNLQGMALVVKRLHNHNYEHINTDCNNINYNDHNIIDHDVVLCMMRQHLEAIGRLHHPNLLPLKAYRLAPNEKLLVYDYMPNGSLFDLLHGIQKGESTIIMDWERRLDVAFVVAKTLAYLHGENIVHGSVKSSNVLFNKDGNVYVSDYGLTHLSPIMESNVMEGYIAPEIWNMNEVTFMADVYSFGVLLLELLTGKYPLYNNVISDEIVDFHNNNSHEIINLPSWVQSIVREQWTTEVFDATIMRTQDIQEQMIQLLQVALPCVSQSPPLRPSMIDVTNQIESIIACIMFHCSIHQNNNLIDNNQNHVGVTDQHESSNVYIHTRDPSFNIENFQ